MLLRIEREWDGTTVPEAEVIEVHVLVAEGGLIVEIEAPVFGESALTDPPGPTDRLWEHEGVSVFVVGSPRSETVPYTEVMLAPTGHYLAMRLAGIRRVVETLVPVEVDCQRDGLRWKGRMVLPSSMLPPQPWTLNAYYTHGAGKQRRYLAWVPVLGEQPDFHRIDQFGRFADGDPTADDESRLWVPGSVRPAWLESSPSYLLLAEGLLRSGRPLHDMDSRDFEMFIGEMLVAEGWGVVEVTRRSGDGGVDVIASREYPIIGPVRTLWQAKRYDPTKKTKVGVSCVRELRGALSQDPERATKAVMVTTSYLTRGALDLVRQDAYRLAHIDKDGLEDWVRDVMLR